MFVLNQRQGFPCSPGTVVTTWYFGFGVVVVGGIVGTFDDETGNMEELGITEEFVGTIDELLGIIVDVDGVTDEFVGITVEFFGIVVDVDGVAEELLGMTVEFFGTVVDIDGDAEVLVGITAEVDSMIAEVDGMIIDVDVGIIEVEIIDVDEFFGTIVGFV